MKEPPCLKTRSRKSRLSVHPSVLMYQFGSHWMDFREIRYWRRL